MVESDEIETRNRELKQWLSKSNCQHHYSKFVDHGITYDLLGELDTASLKEIGINKLGDRLRLELAIGELKAERLLNVIDVNELYKLMNLQISNQDTKLLNRMLRSSDTTPTSESATLTPTDLAFAASTANLGLGLQTTLTGQPAKDSNKNVTFILQDGSTKRVNVTGCFNAQSIKRKVLKKLGIKQQEASYDTYIHSTTNNNDGGDGSLSGVNLLFDVELVTICFSPDRLEKHRIILCPKNEYPTSVAIAVSRKIMAKYDSFMRNQSRHLSQDSLSQYHIPDPKRKEEVAKKPTLRNFFGQRPPSELISSNLAEYFPDTRQKDLEATVRNSVRYSVRLSRRFNLPPGKNGSTSSFGGRASMFSNSTVGRTPSILSVELSRRPTIRTIGDVMVNNITAIDEAVHAVDTLPLFSKPPSIHSNLSERNSDNKSIHSTPSTKTPNPRVSIAASFADHSSSNNNRYSRIELFNIESDDSDEAEDFLTDYVDDEEDDVKNGLDSISEDGPKNWLKGTRIGAGSFGTVYLGMNPVTGELMAVKQISLPDKNSSTDIQKSMLEQQREMTLLKELNHENIVRYLGASTDENYLNIFLEYVPGGSVQSMLSSYGPFEEPLIRNFIRQVLIGLNYLHGEDIIHRDIKGANILIDIKGTVKIGDFGISKKVNSIDEDDNDKKMRRRASLQGSVYWMAPEVVKQTAYTKKADIWSVGCLIVEMFTGKHPFPEFSQMQAIFKIGTHICPQIPEWCTLEAKDFLVKTFELDYEKRPDAIELLSNAFLNPLILSKE